MEYLTRAGKQALNRSAYGEAQAQLQQGLERIRKLPEAPQRDARELELASTLAQALMAREGRPRPRRGRPLSAPATWPRRAADLTQLVVQVFGIFGNVLTSGDNSTAGLLANRVLDLARREGSPASFGSPTMLR